MSYAASLESVQSALERIKDKVHRTPVLTCATLNRMADRSLYFKCENLQKGGAFKARGACNAIFGLSDEAASKGIVTHSSGNHAGAVAMVAQMRGVPAYIVCPEGTPEVKLAAVREYGGQVRICAPNLKAREEACARIQAETGADFVPPYNDGRIISGQGTLALEFLEQVPDLDAIVVPVSGGGMLSGIALAAKGINPRIVVIAAEPNGGDADDVARSKAAGQLLSATKPATIADGLRASMGDLTWPIIRDCVDGVVTVSDAEILAAMRLIMERMKVVVEPSGAVGLAAVLSSAFRDKGFAAHKRVGIVLCGGNVDLRPLWEHYATSTQP